MRRTNPVSSDVVEGRVQARLRALHRSRLKAARAVLDDSGPPRYAHLEAATKAAPREQVRRSRVIARDNGLLVEKMVSILGRRPDPNHDPVQLAKAATATVEDAYRPGPIPLPKSLNKDARTRQLESIVLENERFLARLIGSPGVYSRREWARDSESESRYREQISRFPYRDPTACMPQVNPILAIAHAQTDRAAEMILKNQHAQWAQAQAQARAAQQLPPVPGASPHPSYDAVPPMRATGHVQSQTQARYPSPPTTAPTASTSSFQPAPPSAPRPNTTAPAGQTQRLRAQYTSQGVRVVRTGRLGNSAPRHSSTTTGVITGSQSARYQPLRQQQLAQQQAREAAEERARAREEQKETMVARATSEAQLQPQQQSDVGISSDASGGALASDASDGQTPPEADSVVQLFEDTLVISGRAVLIKIFECGRPWRLELRVFDPWSALEYTLALPMAYVRLCFYQVPDLMLPTNRAFLLQTLLHYLAFAPAATSAGDADGAGDGAGGAELLELLVDIVAPPPRNAVEAEAWRRAHDAAALEQAASDLALEKAAAARAHAESDERRAAEVTQREAERDAEKRAFDEMKQDPATAAAMLQEQIAQNGQSVPETESSSAEAESGSEAAQTSVQPEPEQEADFSSAEQAPDVSQATEDESTSAVPLDQDPSVASSEDVVAAEAGSTPVADDGADGAAADDAAVDAANGTETENAPSAEPVTIDADPSSATVPADDAASVEAAEDRPDDSTDANAEATAQNSTTSEP